MSVFENLNQINVNEHTEQKNGLTYLSWAWAWSEVKKKYPDAVFTIFKDELGRPYIHDPALGYMVFTSVTIDGLTHDMWLPVMDGANKAMKSEPYTYKVKNNSFKYAKKDEVTGKYFDKYGKEQPEYLVKTVEAATMFDINSAIMRCLVKNLALFGMGLYIYAGEDLPEEPRITEKEAMILTNTLKPNQIEWAKQTFNVSDISELTAKQYGNLMQAVNQKEKADAKQSKTA